MKFKNADSTYNNKISIMDPVRGSIVGSSDPRWGNIEGDLQDQTDLIVYISDIKAELEKANKLIANSVLLETSNRATADNVLQTNINKEANNRKANDDILEARIVQEISDRAKGDETLQANLENEASTRKTNDNILDTKINTEISDRSKADSDLATDYNQKFANEKEARETEDINLSNRIVSEIDTRTSEDTRLQTEYKGLIKAEEDARIAGDNTLQTNLNDHAKYAEETYSVITETGTKLELILDSTTYKLKANLYNKNGIVINTSNEIDLPIEELVNNISYDETTKELVFTLKSGTEFRVPLEDIISGLATQKYVDEQDAKKQDSLVAGQNIKLEGVNISTPTYKAGDGIEITSNNTDTERTIKNTYYSAVWGNVQGTLSNQTDLQNALNLKQDDVYLRINDSGQLCVEVEE